MKIGFLKNYTIILLYHVKSKVITNIRFASKFQKILNSMPNIPGYIFVSL